MTVVQNLQQNVEHIRMGLFYLVKKDDTVGIAADFFAELTALVISYISRRRAYHFGHAVLLHIFGHIHANQGIFRTEHGL